MCHLVQHDGKLVSRVAGVRMTLHGGHGVGGRGGHQQSMAVRGTRGVGGWVTTALPFTSPELVEAGQRSGKTLGDGRVRFSTTANQSTIEKKWLN